MCQRFARFLVPVSVLDLSYTCKCATFKVFLVRKCDFTCLHDICKCAPNKGVPESYFSSSLDFRVVREFLTEKVPCVASFLYSAHDSTVSFEVYVYTLS